MIELAEQKKLYVNKLQSKFMHVNAKYNYLIEGRGAGKSTIILAYAVQQRAYDLPGATIGIVGHTFESLLKKVIPAILSGLTKMGYREGIHFVVNERPPKNWAKPIFPVLSYENTIVWHTGTVFVMLSQNTKASTNSYSLQYLIGDEVKFLDIPQLKEETSFAIRGERMTFPDSPHLFGETFTTDMPRLEDAEWLLGMQSSMNNEQIELIYQTSILIADLYKKREIARAEGRLKKVASLSESIRIFEKEINVLRRGSTFFDVSSSFVNLDAIGWSRFLEWSDPTKMPIDIFLSSVCSIRQRKAKEMFYGHLTNRHFYSPPSNGFYEQFRINSQIIKNCLGDGDLNAKDKLILGLDFGNMNSSPVLQLYPGEVRAIKEFYTLKPKGLGDLANEFTEYYRPHQTKVIDVYFDRAGNKFNEQTKKTNAEFFKSKIQEYDNTWVVNLKSVGMGNIPHDLKEQLWGEILSEKDKRFPIFRLNEDNCPCLKSSMQLAPLKINEKNKVEKLKTSEQKDLKDLPMWSTNMSDAIDYPMYQLFYQLLHSKSIVKPYKAKTY